MYNRIMKVVFLDRDGTLIYEPEDGVVRPEDFKILPGTIETLKELQKDHYFFVMITNQDFSKGLNNSEYFNQTQKMLTDLFEKEGIVFYKKFFCPHPLEDKCHCRKPKIGMIENFLKTHDIDQQASFVIGDSKMNDGGFAKNIGIKYFQLKTNGNFPTFRELTKFINA